MVVVLVAARVSVLNAGATIDLDGGTSGPGSSGSAELREVSLEGETLNQKNKKRWRRGKGKRALERREKREDWTRHR